MDTNNVILPSQTQVPTVQLLEDKPSFAMQMILADAKRERHKDTVIGIIIVFLILCWTFSIYMIFSYFANTSTIHTGDTTQTAENDGNSNTINQRG